MLNNKMNVKFNSTNGIMAKTHKKSKITWCHVESSFFKNLYEPSIVQIMLMSDKTVIVEYIEIKYLDDIFNVSQ